MIAITVRNARLNLSRYLNMVNERGEEIIIKNRDVPVAKIIPFRGRPFSKGFPDLSKLRAKQKARPSEAQMLVREDRDGRG